LRMAWVAHATPIKSASFSRGPFKQPGPRHQGINPSLAAGPLATQRRLRVILGTLAARLRRGCHCRFDGHVPRLPDSARVGKTRSGTRETTGLAGAPPFLVATVSL